MPEWGPLGSVRGALSNERPYRDLRNVDANYPFDRSHRFAGIQPNSGFGDHSRLSCSAGIRSSGLGSAGIFGERSARTLAIMRRRPYYVMPSEPVGQESNGSRSRAITTSQTRCACADRREDIIASAMIVIRC